MVRSKTMLGFPYPRLFALCVQQAESFGTDPSVDQNPLSRRRLILSAAIPSSSYSSINPLHPVFISSNAAKMRR